LLANENWHKPQIVRWESNAPFWFLLLNDTLNRRSTGILEKGVKHNQTLVSEEKALKIVERKPFRWFCLARE
jgi:hypothetical protein